MKDFNEHQKTLFSMELNSRRKKHSTALLLNLFFGGFGAHYFYLEKVFSGFVALLLCWTFIPLILSFIELLFCTKGYVDAYNDNLAKEVANKINLYSLPNPQPLHPIP